MHMCSAPSSFCSTGNDAHMYVDRLSFLDAAAAVAAAAAAVAAVAAAVAATARTIATK